MKNCKWCGKELTKTQISRKNSFCSYSCSNQHRYRNVKKEYVCRRCGKTYIKKNTGTKIGTKYCSVFCGSRSQEGVKKSVGTRKKMADAQRHIREEGFFVCDRCGREFSANTELRAHKAHCGHHKENIRCPECGKYFIGKAAYVLHLSHHDKNGEWNKNRIKGIRKYIKEKFLSGNNRMTDTDIEVIFRDELYENGIRWERQYCVDFENGQFHHYDLYLPEWNFLIEVDGDYWHCRRDTDIQIPVLPLHRKNWNNDKYYTSKAKEFGYQIFRFWGTDIRKDVTRCVTELLTFIQEGKCPNICRNIEKESMPCLE